MRKGFLGALLCGAAILSAGAASAAPLQISNTSVLAGVSDYGTLGSDSGTAPGILYDATGSSNYGINDFLTPGDPYEGFYITANGYDPATGAGFDTYSNNNGNSIPGATAILNQLTPTSATSSIISSGVTVAVTYALTTIAGRSVIDMMTTLTNGTGGTLAGLEFLRTLDPDPDVNTFGSFFTNNTLVSSSEACATGPDTGQTICIATDDPTTHGAGVSAAYYKYGATWNGDPADFLGGINDGDGDYSIGLAFALGDLGVGQSVSFDYYYALGADLGTASGGSSVPEPITLSLFGAGVAGAAAMRRRKAKKA